MSKLLTVNRTTEENKAVIRRYYNDLWNAWNSTITEELIDSEITFRSSLAVTVQGIDGFKEYVALVRAAFPDFRNNVEEMIAEGDKVVARLTYTGTHEGTLFGIPPTGKRIEYSGVAIFRIGAGKVIDGWVLGDTLALMRQLGIASLP
jgi:steroid delta-isomerase-like uncharacterized protein